MSDKYQVNKVIKTAQVLLDDPSGTDMDFDYLLPFLNLAWDDLSADLTALGLDFEEDVVEATVAANTSDLAALQADGAALESLITPVYLEWKYAADPAAMYANHEVVRVDRLPDVDPGASGASAYEFRGGRLLITPSSRDITLRVRMKVFTVDFYDANQSVLTSCRNVLAYKIVELVNAPNVRNNVTAMQWAAGKYKESKDTLENLHVKQMQSSVHRIGRMSGRSRRRSRLVVRAGS